MPPPPNDAAAATPAAIADALPPETPASTQLPFCTVTVGASAGGVEALTRLFSLMAPDTGCAFVVALHLAPDRQSLLVPLIERNATMPVRQARDGDTLEPDHIYVVAPAEFVEIRHGRLASTPITVRPPRPMTIDCLMRSAAADQRERAIGVILTGADSDGAMGVKALKSEGGLTLAQLPSSAAHPDMPENAIATGFVDRELAIEDMPAAIAAYAASLAAGSPATTVQRVDSALDEIIERVRSTSGIDFRGYKPPMLQRRVMRRIALARVPDVDAYLKLLGESPEEVAALCDDFLITVTEFFRETEAWNALAAEVLPHLLAEKPEGSAVRVWVPACSSGEEAYTIAMLFLESPLMADRRLTLQVFATDINGRALDIGRRGVYPSTIEHAVPRERLHRFFTHTGENYTVRKQLRDAVMFAPQNVVSDPPFSRMDLVSCRNMLIYMDSALQERVLRLFHFALETGGILFLGKSETIGGQGALFTVTSKRAHIFRRIGQRAPAAPRGATVPMWRVAPGVGAAPRPLRRELDYGRLIRDALLDHRIAAAVLIDGEGGTLYFHGPVQAYLDWPEGAPSTDIFAMVRDDLRPQLRAAVHRAWTDKARAETVATMREGAREESRVRIVVSLVNASGVMDPALLVTFERMEVQPAAHVVARDESEALKALEAELRGTKRELRSTIAELESTNEELKVSNEEAMSMNEELQSANEELETSKEELQSVNEELITVNNQLEEKVQELEDVNDVLGNLLSSTHMPTLFLDRKLLIRRFTPAATALFSLIASDLNRPLTDISSEADIESLVADARTVLERLSPIEREDRTRSGRSYLRRTLPYRTIDDRIEGIVITFTDITELRRGEQDTRRLAGVMRACNDAVIVHDTDGGIESWNHGAETIYGYAEGEMLGKNVGLLMDEETRRTYLRHLREARPGQLLVIEGPRRRKDGQTIDVASSLSVIADGVDGALTIASIERDITPRKAADRRLRESEQRFRTMADSAPVLIWVSDAAGRIEFANQEFAAFCGLEPRELAGRRWVQLLQAEDGGAAPKVTDEAAGGRAGRIELTAQMRALDGELRWMKVTALPRPHDGSGEPGLVGSMVDVHAQVEAQRELRVAGVRKDEFLAMLGHELRNPLVPIRNAAEVLKHLGIKDDRLDWAYETLVQQVGHVTRLVDDLLDISRVTRGALMLHLEPVDVCHALDTAIEATADLARRKRHEVRVDIDERPCFVEGDSIRLVQIFENLIANAAKYTEDGGKIAVSLRCKGAEVQVRVRDNGLGIAPGMQERIFELFVQDARSVDRSQGGLGIGLALVRHLVALHGGRVTASSPGAGKGSEFVVTFPHLSKGIPAAPAPAQGAPAGTRARVLLVDDDQDGGESLAMVLGLMGYEVSVATDLQSALAAARSFRPEIAILDVAMPDADGYEVAKRLRALPEMSGAMAYLTLSGFGQPEDFMRSEQAGMARHLVKPIDPAHLDVVLQELAAKAQRRPPAA